uniref:Transmembrane protein n=1 Tax=Nelumbo nucifera TaxID=4432 RepID=A0A822ZPX0_NELNU|nr:TPA_asm: hypothetical protein HUJ06_002068 [Nelumbo nucifera]
MSERDSSVEMRRDCLFSLSRVGLVGFVLLVFHFFCILFFLRFSLKPNGEGLVNQLGMDGIGGLVVFGPNWTSV